MGKNKLERGASLVEYALLVSLVAVVSIAAVTNVGDKLGSTEACKEGKFVQIAQHLTASGYKPCATGGTGTPSTTQS